MNLTLTVNDSDATLRVIAQSVSATARWRLAAAAIRAWAEEIPADEMVDRHATLAESLNPYQRRELARRYGVDWHVDAEQLTARFATMTGPKRPALMAAAVLWAQQEARGADGIEHLLDQVIPAIGEKRLDALAGEALVLYARDFTGSRN